MCVCVGTVCAGECLRRDACRSSVKSLTSDTFCEVKRSDPTSGLRSDPRGSDRSWITLKEHKSIIFVIKCEDVLRITVM